jgi:hypothetical protein
MNLGRWKGLTRMALSNHTKRDQLRQPIQQTGVTGEGEFRHKLGDWLKATSVNTEDQRRMLQAITHRFPSNVLIHRNTKGKESNKCDLCRSLRIKENRFTSEADLPEQDLGHIQHTCEAISEAHTAAHHRSWRLIHEELARLASSEWRFMCITGEKNLATVWKELKEEFRADLEYMNIKKDKSRHKWHKRDRYTNDFITSIFWFVCFIAT